MNRINRLNVAGALITGLLVFLAAPCAQAATLVWTGGVDNVWSVGGNANWLNAGVPTTYTDGDDVVFDDSTTRTNINISQIVAPGSILFSNSTAKTFMFTNSIITGACSMVKYGAGTVNFGAQSASVYSYSNSMEFTGGTIITQGILKFYMETNALPNVYADGGDPRGFGAGRITINGTNAQFHFRYREGLQRVAVLTNDLEMGVNGGYVDIGRLTSSSIPQQNLSGNIDLYGNFTIKLENMASGFSGATFRVMSGTTRLFNSVTNYLYAPSTDGSLKGIYSQNITNMVPGAQLTLIAGGDNQCSPVEFSGTNNGVDGGMIMRPRDNPAIVYFTSTNAMGGAKMTVYSNAYAGLAFNFSGSVLTDNMVFEDGAILGIESNSTVDIDLNALNKDIWLGSARGATYTGRLTPLASSGAYKLGGAGTTSKIPLILANTDALSGPYALWVGNPISKHQPGGVALAASNSYSGGTVISGTLRASPHSFPTLIARAEGALGTGPVVLNRVNGAQGDVSGPILQVEVPYKVLANDITITGQVGNATINTLGPTTLQGNLALVGTNALNLIFNALGNDLVIFNQAASGKSVTLTSNSRIIQKNGLFDPVNVANLPMNAGYLQGAGATLVLSPGFTWSDLIGERSWTNTQTTAQGQWLGRNFAARGTTQIIDGTGAFETGASNNWLVVNGLTQPTLLGSVVTNNDGSFYANAGVKITRPIEGSNLLFKISNASTGPGLTNNSSVGVVNELAGNISGTLGFEVTGRGIASKGVIPELVLSGLNTWSGNVAADAGNSSRYLSGPGGITMAGTDISGFVRFDGNSSLPTGNGGATAYIQALRGTQQLYGYLLTGGAVDRVYTLPAGMRFLLGGMTSGTYPTFGAALGRASLTGSMVHIFRNADMVPQVLPLFARDADTVFTLGADNAPVKFSGVYSPGVNMGQGWYSPVSNATTMLDRTGTNTLMKTGKGTVVLKNVQYTLADGSGDAAPSFNWQLGSGTPYLFDGVVLETGVNQSNSLRLSKFSINGAIYGLSSDWTVSTGTNEAELNVTSANGYFGFSAYGGNRIMNLRPHISGTTFQYGQTFASPSFFLGGASQAIILNDANAEGEITFCASDIIIDMSGSANREFSVLSTNFAARIPASIQNTSNPKSSWFVKTGPGRLILMAATNSYNGATAISNGTLTVNGLFTASTNGITVFSGGTLDGTGTVRRAVTVAGGGALSAGAGADLIGTLTISSNLVLSSTGTFVVDVSAAGGDQVVVGGADQVVLTGSLVVVPAAGFDMAGGQQILIMTAPGGFSGAFTTVTPRGYSVVNSGTTLYLKRDSPGFIFRIQ